jgi:hypothetical protein
LDKITRRVHFVLDQRTRRVHKGLISKGETTMKAIINGVRYDTDKAILIGEASYGNHGDFARWEAGLYVSPRSRRYFLAGRGGPMTRWSRKVEQNSWTGGSGVVPMSRADALEWAEQNLATAQVEAGFADVIEDA